MVPDDPVIAEHLGDVYARSGQLDQAAKAYRRALRLGPEDEKELRRKIEDLRKKTL
jgi:predicted TPR repeat methyltransferase